MANTLGTAANALDETLASLQPQIVAYLADGGNARTLSEWLLQGIVGSSPAMLNAIVKGRKGRAGSFVANKTLLSLTGGAIYP
jgi:hypothetical protein